MNAVTEREAVEPRAGAVAPTVRVVMSLRRAAQGEPLGRLKTLPARGRENRRSRTMAFETEEHKRDIQRWSRLAIELIAAADSGRYDHITPADMVRELQEHDVFARLTRELPATVWEISKLTDVDRHQLSGHWRGLLRPTNRNSST